MRAKTAARLSLALSLALAALHLLTRPPERQQQPSTLYPPPPPERAPTEPLPRVALNWEPGKPLPFPLKRCTATLFRHLGKTGGSTVQAIFRRNEQLGDFYYASFGTWVEIRPVEWNLLIAEMKADPDAFIQRHPRMLVSFHKQTAEQFPPSDVAFTNRKRRAAEFPIWEDIAWMRTAYESRGCGFTLATLLRKPDPDLYVSDFLFEGAPCVPSGKALPQWIGSDIQTSALLGWPNGWNSRAELTEEHRAQAERMLAAFDLVGTTDRFVEFLLLLAARTGLPNAQYRRMNVGASGKTRERLTSDPDVRRAITNRSRVDTQLYAWAAERFDRAARAGGAVLASLAAKFGGSSAGGYVGGTPPDDKWMVTSPYLCPQGTVNKLLPNDFGGCDLKLGQKSSSIRTLTQTKRYIPCERTNCTKIAADRLSCSHVWEAMQALSSGRARRYAADTKAARWLEEQRRKRGLPPAGVTSALARSLRDATRLPSPLLPKGLQAGIMCSVESPPDGLM